MTDLEKHEFRNTKYETNTNINNSNDQNEIAKDLGLGQVKCSEKK